MTRRILRTLFAALLTALSLSAQELRPEITGDVNTNIDTGETVVTRSQGRDPRLTYGNAILEADEIRYNHKTEIATAHGNARLTLGAQRVLADEIVYNTADRTFKATHIRLGEFPLYVSGTDVFGTNEEVTVNNAVITYHEPSFVGPLIKADKIVYRPEQSFRAEHARIGVGPLLPLRFSDYEQGLDQPLLSSLTAKVGYSSEFGAHLGVGTRLPVSTGVEVGGELNFYSKRGLLIGPTAAYHGGSGDQSYSGKVKAGYIHDHGERFTDILNEPIPPDRGYVDWTHHQHFSETLTLNSQFVYWSDSAIIRDFRENEFYPVQQPDTFLEAAHTSENYIISAFLRAQPNPYYRVQERLPEVRYDLLPYALPLGVYQQAQASAAALREDDLHGGPETRSDRLDAYYGLSRPINPSSWLNITPVGGARVTHYTRATGGKDDYTRTLGEVGADASIRASGLYAYKNERWNIDGIRHLITPKLSYRYIPEASKGRAYIPQIDDRTFQTYLEPLGLGEQRAIDDLQPTNTLRLALNNTFQTRDGSYGSRDLLRLNFASDFHPETDPGQEDFSAIHTELAFTPVKWLEFNLYSSVTPQDLKLRELNTGFTLRDGEVWSLYVGNHFLYDNFEEYVIEGRYRFNETWGAAARMQYDARLGRFNEQRFTIVQNLNNLWDIRYGISVNNGDIRASAPSFDIEINLVGF